MSAQHFAAAWDQLPLGVQQHILVLSGLSTRRVSKAWRAAFDATNDTLCFRRVHHPGQNLETAAIAAATRVVRNSASLTAVNLMEYDDDAPLQLTQPFALPDLLAAGAASGQATCLRKLTGLQLDPECCVQQLHALQQCTGLTHLDINGSDMEDWFPEQGHQAAVELTAAVQGMRRLVHLHVRDLQGEGSEAALASVLQPLTQLQHLHFRCSGLGGAGLAALAPALSAMPGLQTLDVSNNSLEGAGGAEALCGLLGTVPGLTHLDVSGTDLGEEGIALLAPVLRGMTCLQTLYLTITSIGDGGMVVLAPVLASLPNLHTLDVSDNKLEASAVSALQPVLAREGSPLRKLDISYNRLGLEGARALAEGLGASAQLWDLRLKNSHLGHECWVVLAPALRCLAPSLQSLELGYGSLDAVGSTALAPALQQLTGLTCLKANGILDAAAMESISPALMGMRRLQSLDLNDSVMGAEGTAALAAALPALAGSLTHLALSYCSIDVEAAANALAPALAQVTCLVELHLYGNRLEPFGAEWLVPVLSCLPHLRKVDLTMCDLGAQGCMAVAQAVRERDGIVLVLRGNGVTEGGAFQKALLSISGVNVHLRMWS